MLKKSIILFSLALLFSCNNTAKVSNELNSNASEITNTQKVFTATEFNERLNNNADVVLLDVRTSEEFSKGHLKNAKNLNWNDASFSEKINDLDKEQTVYIYCLSGGRSGQAANFMRENGFKDVRELQGGILAWKEAKLPLEENGVALNEFSVEDYKKIMETNQLVLVDFYAQWCAPCKKMKPYLDKIEKDYGNSLKLVRIDVDKNKLVTEYEHVSGLPVLKLIQNNKVIWESTGYIDENTVITEIKKAL